MNCAVCGGDNFRKYNSIPDLEACSACGFVRKKSNGPGTKYYEDNEEYGSGLDSAYKKDARLREVERRFSIVRSLMNFSDGKTLLEVGCHEGLFLNKARAAGTSVFGIEPNRKAAARARQIGLDVFCGTFEEFDASRSYDVIVLFHVLEHFDNPRAALEKIYSLLDPGGLLALEVPNIASYPARKGGPRWTYINDEHVSYFSPGTIEMLLTSVGFIFGGVKRRDFDEWHVGISENLRRLGILKYRDRIFDRQKLQVSGAKKSVVRRYDWTGIKNIIRFILVCLVKLSGREHFIFVYARKPL